MIADHALELVMLRSALGCGAKYYGDRVGNFIPCGENTMNKQVRVYFWVMAVVVIALSSARTAVAQNTKFGTGALARDTTGTDDTALGYYALFSNKTGSYNTATGFWALPNNTSAS